MQNDGDSFLEATRFFSIMRQKHLSEFGKVMKAKFTKNIKRDRVVQLTPYVFEEFVRDYIFDLGELLEIFFFAIKESEFVEVRRVLKQRNLEIHLNNICCLIQEYVCFKTMNSIIRSHIKHKSNLLFQKEFASLFNVLTNEDVRAIKVITKKRSASVTIENTGMLLLIMRAYKELLLNTTDVFDFLYDLKNDYFIVCNEYNEIEKHEKTKSYALDAENPKLNSIKKDVGDVFTLQSAMIKMLAYIQTKTTFKHNVANGKVFSNSQMELIYDIFQAVQNENDSNKNIESDAPKNYIRINLTRRFVTTPNDLQKYLKAKPLKTEHSGPISIKYLKDSQTIKALDEISVTIQQEKNAFRKEIETLFSRKLNTPL